MEEEKELKAPELYSGKPTTDPSRTPNELGQRLLLKAISEGETDPEKLAMIAGMKSAAHVVVALDKISLRKEWHGALASAGLTLDNIASKLKSLSESTNEKTSLGAIKTLLTSIGLSEYKDEGVVAKNWEEVVIGAMQKNMRGDVIDAEFKPAGEYEVKMPDVPKEVIEKWTLEKEDAKSLYGGEETNA